MRKFLILSLLCAVFPITVHSADANFKVTYQGFFKSGGVPVNATKGFVFRVRNGSGGAVQWQSACTDISVSTGLFRTVLGSNNFAGYNWDTVQWNNVDPYLEVLVGDAGTCNNSVSLTQEQLFSTPYSIYSSSTTGLLNTGGKLRVNSSTATYNGRDMYFVPQGLIIMWSGTVATIPAGWRLCDGTNGTPDLRDKFIVGAGSTYNPGDGGGVTNHQHTIDNHQHNLDIAPFGSGGSSNNVNGSDPGSDKFTSPGHTHSVDPGNTASTATGITSDSTNTLPPYYALAYIMKL